MNVQADYGILEVTPLTPAIGADVRGIDLAAGIDEQAFAEIRRAFLQHQVLFFREQSRLAPERQIAFGRRFGELHQHPAAPTHPEHPEIFVIHTHKDSKVANGGGWHSDVTCDEAPPMATMLQLHVLPSSGGDTLFASMYAAYDRLSDSMKAYLETLTAAHESEHIYRGRYADRGVDDTGKVYPSAVHPVIRSHPETGRKALFVNRAFTTRINELTRGESHALLDHLFGLVEDPSLQVRNRWAENDIALWDNRCVQHMALWDYWPEERKGHRVTIEGDRPFLAR
jgi:taurine dioxygenase